MKLRKGDYVQVMKGKDADKKGRILSVVPRSGKALVEGVNFVKRHTKPGRVDRQGGIIQKEMPLPMANLRYFCMKCSRPARLGFKPVGTGKTRYCKKCGEAVENAAAR